MLSDFEKNNHCIEIPPDWDLPKYPPYVRVIVLDELGYRCRGMVIGLKWNYDVEPGIPEGVQYYVRLDNDNPLYSTEGVLSVSESEIIGLAPA